MESTYTSRYLRDQRFANAGGYYSLVSLVKSKFGKEFRSESAAELYLNERGYRAVSSVYFGHIVYNVEKVP